MASTSSARIGPDSPRQATPEVRTAPHPGRRDPVLDDLIGLLDRALARKASQAGPNTNP